MLPEVCGLESCSSQVSSSHSSHSQKSLLQQSNKDLKLKSSPESQGKVRKKKMSVPKRIIRLLESSKRLHFHNVSLSKKRQMCINRCLPDLKVPLQSGEVLARQEISSPQMHTNLFCEPPFIDTVYKVNHTCRQYNKRGFIQRALPCTRSASYFSEYKQE